MALKTSACSAPGPALVQRPQAPCPAHQRRLDQSTCSAPGPALVQRLAQRLFSAWPSACSAPGPALVQRLAQRLFSAPRHPVQHISGGLTKTSASSAPGPLLERLVQRPQAPCPAHQRRLDQSTCSAPAPALAQRLAQRLFSAWPSACSAPPGTLSRLDQNQRLFSAALVQHCQAACPAVRASRRLDRNQRCSALKTSACSAPPSGLSR